MNLPNDAELVISKVSFAPDSYGRSSIEIEYSILSNIKESDKQSKLKSIYSGVLTFPLENIFTNLDLDEEEAEILTKGLDLLYLVKELATDIIKINMNNQFKVGKERSSV